MLERAARDNDIRRAMDACLPGLENKPDFQREVLRRVRGETEVKKKLSVGLVLAIVLVLLAVTALAVSALIGLFRLEQAEVGAIRSCVSTGDTLYLMTTGGLKSWTPDEGEPATLITSKELEDNGLSFDALLYLKDDSIGMLDREGKALWEYRNGELTLRLKYAGTDMDMPEMRFDKAVYQDGWLFLTALPTGAAREDAILCRADPMTGEMRRLPDTGVLEVCAYEPGGLLVLISDLENNEDGVAILDTATGSMRETLYTTHSQGVKGIAYDKAYGGLYAAVGGRISRWNGVGWTVLQSYAFHHLTDMYAVVGDGYASVSFNAMQYVPFALETTVDTLRIRGNRSADNADEEFQAACPGVAVARESEPAFTAGDARRAIEAGDTTDLFHLRLDGDAVKLFSDGLAAPLTLSNALVSDAMAMPPSIRSALFVDDMLYAVPSAALCMAWEAESEIPATFAGLIGAHAAWERETPYIAWSRTGGAWGKKDYADYLLAAYIAERARAGERTDFRSQRFIGSLKLLKEAALPTAAGDSGGAAITPNIIINLSGMDPDEPASGEARVYTAEAAAQPPAGRVYWALPPAVSEGKQRTAQMLISVYLLNPNAQNPEAAIAYLEYVAAHRPPDHEALLKPDAARPALFPGVRRLMEQLAIEQREEDAVRGEKTDEAALEARLDAIRAAPDSWAVTEHKLAAYKEQIAPHIDLRLSSLLSASAKKEGGVYQRMLKAIMEYVEGGNELDECLYALEKELNAHAS